MLLAQVNTSCDYSTKPLSVNGLEFRNNGLPVRSFPLFILTTKA